MRDLHYFDCPYAEDDQEELTDLAWHEYPCHHPDNRDHTCPLRNKKPNQKALCCLPEK